MLLAYAALQCVRSLLGDLRVKKVWDNEKDTGNTTERENKPTSKQFFLQLVFNYDDPPTVFVSVAVRLLLHVESNELVTPRKNIGATKGTKSQHPET